VLRTLSFTSLTVQVGAAWVLRVLVTDDGVPSGDVPTVVVTAPAGAAAPVDMVATCCPGVFSLTVYPAEPGRHFATAEHAEHGAVSWVAEVVDVVANDDMPSVTTCNNYIGDHSYTDEQVQEMLDQERDAQFRVCRVPAAYPKDLRGALHRRVQRALHMLALALAVRETVDGESSMVVPGNDPEVRRLERPWRRRPLG
jgi:hypothetical protein